jgi:biopolymer transport protein ExbB
VDNNLHGLVAQILALPFFRAEWVLYFLLVVSLVSVAVMSERAVFYRRRRIPLPALRAEFAGALARKDYAAAAAALQRFDTLETNVVLFGLREHSAGPDAVEDLVSGATAKEKERYEERLGLLATIASNAPFVGLFGTVLGIIRAFNDLSGNLKDASSAVMAGVAEALVATAVGLLVAIPALVAYNVFKRSVKVATNNAHLLSHILFAHLKTAETAEGGLDGGIT